MIVILLEFVVEDVETHFLLLEFISFLHSPFELLDGGLLSLVVIFCLFAILGLRGLPGLFVIFCLLNMLGPCFLVFLIPPQDGTFGTLILSCIGVIELNDSFYNLPVTGGFLIGLVRLCCFNESKGFLSEVKDLND